MQYRGMFYVDVEGRQNLPELLENLQKCVILDIENEDDNIGIQAIEIDWDTLEENED